MNEEKTTPLSIQIDPQTDTILEQRIAIPYTTTLPSFTPTVNGIRQIYNDGTNYWFYIYANGAWRSTKLDSTGFPSGAVQGDILYYSGSAWTILPAGTSGYFLKTQGASANPVWASANVFDYGDGSDGNVTISGDTTLSRDMFYDTLVVNSGVTLFTNGFRVYAKTSITVNGTISVKGGNGGNGSNGANGVGDNSDGAGGAGGVAGTPIPSGTIRGSGASGAGGHGGTGRTQVGKTDGGNGVNDANSVQNITPANSGNGGDGGGADASHAGSSKGTSGTTTQITKVKAISIATAMAVAGGFLGVGATPGGAGAGGGAAPATTPAASGGGGGGGGAGANGGIMWLASPTITVSATGSLDARGGNGGNGGDGGSASGAIGDNLGGGGGGGGAPGNGGVIILVTSNYTNAGSALLAAGSNGTRGFGNSSGTNGTSSGSGSSGTLYQVTI